MKRKYIAILACLGILMLMLAGCQGYKPPKYKSPDQAEDMEDAEEVDIDLSELDEDFEEVDQEAEYEEMEDEYVDEEDYYEPEPYVPPAATVEESEDTYVEAEYRTIDDDEPAYEEDEDYTRAAYQTLYEDESDDSTPTLTVTEGDTVKINVKATDQDGDPLTYTFSSPLNSDGEWRTRLGDAGVYTSTIIVSDGKEDVKRVIKIIVEPENNKPILTVDSRIVVEEGDTVRINPSVYDADNDKMTISYSGWMTTDTKVTNYQDAGTHTVKVTVSDGISKVSQEVEVVVNDVNRPPEVEIEF